MLVDLASQSQKKKKKRRGKEKMKNYQKEKAACDKSKKLHWAIDP
jgi:hypothetical protein